MQYLHLAGDVSQRLRLGGNASFTNVTEQTETASFIQPSQQNESLTVENEGTSLPETETEQVPTDNNQDEHLPSLPLATGNDHSGPSSNATTDKPQAEDTSSLDAVPQFPEHYTPNPSQEHNQLLPLHI